ncbi:MAG: hypothetical protein EAZ18_00140 [Oscillatoriales cyanobacterium]|nr:MAG: hypothetical protein EAZ18_00140 [Oscillatoriales cyanobacterium]
MANEPENLQTAPTTEVSTAAKPEFKKAQPKEDPKVVQPAEFATEYFQILGLSVCTKCGSKKQTDGFGKIVCTIGITAKKECPMLAGKEDK